MPLNSSPSLAFGMTCLLLVSVPGRAEDAKKVNYKDHVAPIFQNRCNGCHNADKKKGGLVLDTYGTAMEGGGSGAVIEPGDPDNSRLFLLIAHEEEPSMPPNSPKIPDAELDLIKQWISLGAPETDGSPVAASKKPKLNFKLDPSSIGKPDGPPAMPEEVSTEPVIVSDRPNAITALATSPWAPLAAISGHKQVLLYNTETQRLAAVFPFPEGTIYSLKFSRDGGVLVAGGGRGGQSGRVIGWDVRTGERLFEVGKEYDIVVSCDISPDRSLVALGGPSKVLRVYNTSDGELVYENKKHTEWVTAVAFSPDGVLLASGDRNGGLLVWEGLTGREFYDLRGHSAMITDLSWRLDSNVLASSSEDGSVRLWEMINGNQIKSWGAHGGGTESIRFAKDGRLVSTGRDRVAKLWDQNGAAQKQFEAFNDIALQAAFTFDDKAIVAGDWTGEVRLFDAAEGKRIGNLAANPTPVAARLEEARKALAVAQLAADNAATELASIRGRAQQAEAALNQAQQALQAGEAEAQQAAQSLSTVEADVAAKRQAEQAASNVYSSAEFDRQRALTMRNDVLANLRARSEALRNARTAFESSQTERDRLLFEKAESALLAATKEAETSLPALAAMIEAANPAREAVDKATAERIAVEIPLDALRNRREVANHAVPRLRETVSAATAAREAATRTVTERTPEVQKLLEAAASLKLQVEALTSELSRNAEVASQTPSVDRETTELASP